MNVLEDPYPYQQLVGFDIVDWSDKGCRLELPLREDHGNRYGLPHGGIHATLLDTCMGFAGSWTGDAEVRQMAMTLALSVQYLSRPMGKTLIARGWKTGGGRSTFFAEGVVEAETGELIAKGTGTFRYRARAGAG